ncbi:hypothetical protein GGQ74_001649 [Desulfobaculum xiamenense]|uniref:Lipoprotein n=1 Tax=Desulfobaculum xiamenense TaxID=995050 RepID=A0A846QGQ0_9BACT|nr:hypothetical protein [Desulfobaculum xiamenense]NJB67976.1 hypothetical protein [Desulfobaculum xiamenense]
MHRTFLVILAMVSLLTLCSCESALQQRGSTSPEQTRTSAAKAMSSYQEFDDVLIPNDLKLDQKNSFVFETPNFKTGIVTYKGSVDAVDLANFFERNLTKDNWRLRSKMKYSRTIMVFEKPDRDCIINILDGTFDTVVEVMVAPRQDGGDVPGRPISSPLEENLAQ